LGERGFDCDELLRCVFQPKIVGEFLRFSLRVAFDLSQNGGEDAVPEFLTHLGEDMLERAGASLPDESFPAYLSRVAQEAPVTASGQRIAGWINHAPLYDLLYWRLPQRLEWDGLPELEVGTRVCESRWLADRFLLAYLQDWHTASLHDEYRLNRGVQQGTIPPELMALRCVPQERLDAEIAKRAVEGKAHDPRALLTTAVEYLQAGDIDEAIALFQGALTVAPNLWVKNCLAFCLVPADPTWAELMFRELLAEDYDPPLVRANLAATLRLQGNIPEAHAHAREGLERIAGSPPRSAYLWGFEGDAPSLMPDVDIENYLRFVLSWG
jgi:tetratricopeptide (TPR) repeat protein